MNQKIEEIISSVYEKYCARKDFRKAELTLRHLTEVCPESNTLTKPEVVILEQIDYTLPLGKKPPTKQYFLQHVGTTICEGKPEGGGFDTEIDALMHLCSKMFRGKMYAGNSTKRTYIYVDGHHAETVNYKQGC